jgi:DNA invertase Pin-like site-specific DNA recombinase
VTTRPGGPRRKLSDAEAATVRRMYQAIGPDGKRLHTVTEIAQTVGIHRTTIYDYLKRER